MRRSKIIATLGPASWGLETLQALIEAGMDVARLNLSHLEPDALAPLIERVQTASRLQQKPVGILLDTQGPEVRLGHFPGGKMALSAGDHLHLWTAARAGTNPGATVSWTGFFAQMTHGQRILLDDGKIIAHCARAEADHLELIVETSGELLSHKKVSVPGMAWALPILTPADEILLAEGIAAGAALVAVSFVRGAEDIATVRRFLQKFSDPPTLIAKIEHAQAVESLDAIVEAADGVMVARGDLGVELSPARVPGLQKEIIRHANSQGKVVITATEMLESMVTAQRPTRAEASDVANAVWDGSDALMLSAETATGEDPAHAVRTMAEIAALADIEVTYRLPIGWTAHEMGPSVAQAAATVAETIAAEAIITPTNSGFTPRMVSKLRPSMPILAFSPSAAVRQQLTLIWGVIPQAMEWTPEVGSLWQNALARTASILALSPGAHCVVTMGDPPGAPTNILRVERLGHDVERH